MSLQQQGLDYTVEMFNSPADPKLKALRESNKIVFETNIYDHCLDEYFDILHPWLKPGNRVYVETHREFLEAIKETNRPIYIYYPWSKTLIKSPNEHIYNQLRTSRNRNLVTAEEQTLLRSKVVGVAGMSVGSNILNTLVMTGTSCRVKIADFDVLSVPNMNRLMAPVSAVGTNKTVFFARRSLEVDPFMYVEAFPEGLTEDKFEVFFSKPKIDLYIEEMDSPYLKIASRKLAKKLHIPVIMAADNGDGVLIDVERFDLDPDYPLFHGVLDKVIDSETITPQLTFAQKLTTIASMVHLEEATPRAQDSLEEVGTTLNTWPQLGTAALMAGVALTFVARQILLGLPMPSGRYHISPEENLIPGYAASTATHTRVKHTQNVMKNFRAFMQFIETAEKI